MAAQHLPRDLLRPSSGYEEVTQKKKTGFPSYGHISV